MGINPLDSIRTIDIDYVEVIDEPIICLSAGKFDVPPHDLEGK